MFKLTLESKDGEEILLSLLVYNLVCFLGKEKCCTLLIRYGLSNYYLYTNLLLRKKLVCQKYHWKYLYELFINMFQVSNIWYFCWVSNKSSFKLIN